MKFSRASISPLAKGIMTLSAGAAASQAITFLAYPVLTRLFSPDAFGFAAVYSSFLGIIATISAFRYNYAIPLARRDQNAFDILFLALSINVLTAVIVGIVGLLFPEALASLLGEQSLPRLLAYLLPIGILLSGTYQALTMWAVRTKEFKVISTTQVAQKATSAILRVTVGLLHPTGPALVISDMVGSGVGIWSVASRTVRGKGLTIPNVARLRGAAKRYWQFALLGTPAALLNAAAMSSPALLLAALFSLSDAGQFSLAMSVIGVPLALFRTSIERVFLAETGKLGKARAREIMSLMKKFTYRSLSLALLPALLLAVFGPVLFEVGFGEAWTLAGQFSRYFSLYLITNLVSTPFESVFFLFEKQHVYLLLNTLKASLAVAAFTIPHLLRLSATSAIVAYSIAFAFYYVVLGLVARAILIKASR